MAMPRPGGKALKIAQDTVPGLRVKDDDNANPIKGPKGVDVETLKISIIDNGGRLPKKYR